MKDWAGPARWLQHAAREQEKQAMSRIEKPFWTRIFLAAFAVGTLGLLGSAIAVAEHTHASITE